MKIARKYAFVTLSFLLTISLYASNLPTKNITKITVQDTEYTYQYTINYDSQNRITKIVPDHSEIFGITNLEYGLNSFRISKGDTFVSCSLNKKGYIKVVEDGDFSSSMFGNMFYNEKGQLASIEYMNEELFFTWENDNMVEINIEDEQIYVTYTTLENKNQFGLLLKIEEENCTPVFPYYSLLGRATRHLPASIRQGEEKISYNYKIDEDGFVTEITMIYPNNSKTVFYRFAYE